jgi:hypothetical protein
MPGENIDSLHRANEAINRQDLDAFLGDTPFDETIWQLARWRSGRIIWWRVLESRAAAFEAAGLSE